MKDKLLSILDELENRDLSEFYYELTINLTNITNSYEKQKFNVINIKNILKKYNNIESYNLTIKNRFEYDEDRYIKYYSDIDFIFYSGGIRFTYGSPYHSNREIKILNINSLFEICNEHVLSSQRLFNLINNI